MAIQKPLPTQEEFDQMDEVQRAFFNEDYYRGAFKSQGLSPTFWQWIKYKLGPLYGLILSGLVIVLVYGVINLVLWGSQELMHKDEKNRMTEISRQLFKINGKIAYYEDLNNRGKITDEEYDTYTMEVDTYNELIEEYNKLAEEVGTTYYVLPIPGRGH